MTDRQPAECWLTDMDGVLVHEGVPVPGAAGLHPGAGEVGQAFLVLTNNSIYTPRDLQRPAAYVRDRRAAETAIWTSALATAQFLDYAAAGRHGVRDRRGRADHRAARDRLHADRPRPGLRGARRDPHLLVQAITRAIRLIDGGARFIATNPDPTGPSAEGALPATGAVAALITRATGVEPYFVGQAQPADDALGAEQRRRRTRETTAMIGDRMDTDIVAGMEAGLQTVLVLSGVDPRRRSTASRTGRAGWSSSIADLVDEIH